MQTNLKSYIKNIVIFVLGYICLIALAFLYLKSKNYNETKFNLELMKENYPKNTIAAKVDKLEPSVTKNILYTDQRLVNTLYQTLKDIDILFNKVGIEYIIKSGTILGSVRNKGLIPWDDDADLTIMPEDVTKLKALEPSLKKLGYGFKYENYMYRIYDIKNCARHSKIWGDIDYPGVDIFVMQYNKDKNIIEYTEATNAKRFPNEWFYPSNYYPRKQYKFGPLDLYGPSNPHPYINRHFGRDWQSKAVVAPKHYNSPYYNTVVFDLSEEFNEAGVPDIELNDNSELIEQVLKSENPELLRNSD